MSLARRWALRREGYPVAAADADQTVIYKEIARTIRTKIREGAYAEGQSLPSQQAMADEYGVSITSIRRALALLQSEGLIELLRGQRTRVCRRPTPQIVLLPYGASVIARMPTPDEKVDLHLPNTATPVLVVSVDGRPDALYPGTTTVLKHPSS